MAKDKDKKKEILLKVTASSYWWKNSLAVLEASSERAMNSAEGASYLACIYINVYGNTSEMMTQSAWSTTHVDLSDGQVEVEGEGKYLVLTQEFLSYMSSMPSDGEIVVEFTDTEYEIKYNEDEITFSSSVIEMPTEELAPSAVSKLPENHISVKTESADIINAYKTGSSMAKQGDKEVSAGYDPLSACMLSINEQGMSVLTVSSGSAESFITGVVSNNLSDGDSLTTLTFPKETFARLSKFSFMGVFNVAIGEDKSIYAYTDNIMMKISPIDLGNKSSKFSYETVLKVINPAWENRIVTATIPAKDIKSAMSRAKSAHADAIKLTVMATTVKVSSRSIMGNDAKPFTQKITSSTNWYTDDEKYISVSLSSDSLRKVFAMTVEKGEFIFDIALNAQDNKPWAIIVHTGDDFTPEDPHNFFVLSALRR